MSKTLMIIGNIASNIYLLRRFAEANNLDVVRYHAIPGQPLDNQPALIILDMDDMIWQDALRQLPHSALDNIPIIACSWREMTIPENIDYFLQKPISFNTFQSALNALGILTNDCNENTPTH